MLVRLVLSLGSIPKLPLEVSSPKVPLRATISLRLASLILALRIQQTKARG